MSGPAAWKFLLLFLLKLTRSTWLEEPVVVENVGRGMVEQVEEGPRPNLKITLMKKKKEKIYDLEFRNIL